MEDVIKYKFDIDLGTTGLSEFQAPEDDTNDFIITDSSYGTETPYILPDYSRILQNIHEVVKKIKNQDIQNIFVNLVKRIQHYLFQVQSLNEEISHLPPFNVKIIEDGSVLLEWTFRDFRIGFSLEPNIAHSSWYLLSNDNLERIDESGYLSFENIDDVIQNVVSFVVSNT